MACMLTVKKSIGLLRLIAICCGGGDRKISLRCDGECSLSCGGEVPLGCGGEGCGEEGCGREGPLGCVGEGRGREGPFGCDREGSLVVVKKVPLTVMEKFYSVVMVKLMLLPYINYKPTFQCPP